LLSLGGGFIEWASASYLHRRGLSPEQAVGELLIPTSSSSAWRYVLDLSAASSAVSAIARRDGSHRGVRPSVMPYIEEAFRVLWANKIRTLLTMLG